MNASSATLVLCQLDDVPDNGCAGFNPDNNTALEATIFAVKQGAAVFIYQNLCPHLGLPLEWMPHRFLDRDGQYIQCATHGALFRIHDGLCVAGPCQGESLRAIPFEIREKSIILRRSDMIPADNLSSHSPDRGI